MVEETSNNMNNSYTYGINEAIKLLSDKMDYKIECKESIKSFKPKAKNIIGRYNDPYPHLRGCYEKRVIGMALELCLQEDRDLEKSDSYGYDALFLGYKVEIKARVNEEARIPLDRYRLESNAHILLICDVQNDIIYGYDIYNMKWLNGVVSGRLAYPKHLIRIDKDVLVLKRGGGYVSSWR